MAADTVPCRLREILLERTHRLHTTSPHEISPILVFIRQHVKRSQAAMKVLERLGLIDRIGRELQSRMSYGEIDTYLKTYGVNTKKKTSGVNSKWVYSKELLADEGDDVILRIANELAVPHNYVVADASKTLEATFWEPSHFKLFLSHLSSFKQTTGKLQAALRKFGISAFVAHVEIEPTREWLDEIEAGLHSMDALAAILMPGFKESNWTDQEVGVAVGRGVLIIPIMRGLNGQVSALVQHFFDVSVTKSQRYPNSHGEPLKGLEGRA